MTIARERVDQRYDEMTTALAIALLKFAEAAE